VSSIIGGYYQITVASPIHNISHVVIGGIYEDLFQ